MSFYHNPILWMLGTVFMVLAVFSVSSLLRPTGAARKGGDA